jgi:hypothetical protein
MIYFDTEKEAYSQKETLLQWGKILLLECSDEDFAKLQSGEKIWQDDKIIDNSNYNKEQLEKAKTAKYNEANEQASLFEMKNATLTVLATNYTTKENNTYHIEAHFVNMTKFGGLAKSLSVTDTMVWNTKENVNVILTQPNIEKLAKLMLELNAKLWTVDFPTFNAQIEACTTIDEVNAINIEYVSSTDVVDITVK